VEKYCTAGQAAYYNTAHVLRTRAPQCYVIHTLPVLYVIQTMKSLDESCFCASDLTTRCTVYSFTEKVLWIFKISNYLTQIPVVITILFVLHVKYFAIDERYFAWRSHGHNETCVECAKVKDCLQ